MRESKDVEVISLGDYDPEKKRRDFDAISFGRFYWRGRLDFVLMPMSDGTKEARIYVASDRNDVLGDDCAVRPGVIEEVSDDDRAREVIGKAIVQCFDHSTTYEAISDGQGGYIILDTDT